MDDMCNGVKRKSIEWRGRMVYRHNALHTIYGSRAPLLSIASYNFATVLENIFILLFALSLSQFLLLTFTFNFSLLRNHFQTGLHRQSFGNIFHFPFSLPLSLSQFLLLLAFNFHFFTLTHFLVSHWIALPQFWKIYFLPAFTFLSFSRRNSPFTFKHGTANMTRRHWRHNALDTIYK